MIGSYTRGPASGGVFFEGFRFSVRGTTRRKKMRRISGVSTREFIARLGCPFKKSIPYSRFEVTGAVR